VAQQVCLRTPGDAEGKSMMDDVVIQAWNPYSADCPCRLVLERLADKWALLVLGLLEPEPEPLRFNAMRRRIEGVSQKMLSQTLKNLERDGLVRRQAFVTVPVTVEYTITPLGATLADTARALRDWSSRHMGEIAQAQRDYDARQG
jgi:DNA-binding HxlR family transcriptional regulator